MKFDKLNNIILYNFNLQKFLRYFLEFWKSAPITSRGTEYSKKYSLPRDVIGADFREIKLRDHCEISGASQQEFDHPL